MKIRKKNVSKLFLHSSVDDSPLSCSLSQHTLCIYEASRKKASYIQFSQIITLHILDFHNTLFHKVHSIANTCYGRISTKFSLSIDRPPQSSRSALHSNAKKSIWIRVCVPGGQRSGLRRFLEDLLPSPRPRRQIKHSNLNLTNCCDVIGFLTRALSPPHLLVGQTIQQVAPRGHLLFSCVMNMESCGNDRCDRFVSPSFNYF